MLLILLNTLVLIMAPPASRWQAPTHSTHLLFPPLPSLSATSWEVDLKEPTAAA